jgi:hypothetical protein
MAGLLITRARMAPWWDPGFRSPTCSPCLPGVQTRASFALCLLAGDRSPASPQVWERRQRRSSSPPFGTSTLRGAGATLRGRLAPSPALRGLWRGRRGIPGALGEQTEARSRWRIAYSGSRRSEIPHSPGTRGTPPHGVRPSKAARTEVGQRRRGVRAARSDFNPSGWYLSTFPPGPPSAAPFSAPSYPRAPEGGSAIRSRERRQATFRPRTPDLHPQDFHLSISRLQGRKGEREKLNITVIA